MIRAVLGGLCLALIMGCDDGASPPATTDMSDMTGGAEMDGGGDAEPVDIGPAADMEPMPDAGPAPDMAPGCEPTGDEICDGRDNDCDDAVDEEVVRGCWDGPPGTQGRGLCRNGVQTCDAGEWGPCEEQVLPVREICNTLDDDCDGQTDEALFQACGIAPSGGVGECRAPQEACVGGEWGPCGQPVAPVDEICNGLDDDCDGAGDEGFPDSDGDGIGDCVDEDLDGDGVPNISDRCPEVSDPEQADTDGDRVGDACDDDDDGDGFPDEDDCAPLDRDAFPGGEELCDGVDGDCDGAVDEALEERCYDGPLEAAGLGECTRGVRRCVDAAWTGCEGQVLPADEACDGRDTDCDGAVDEGLMPGFVDGDGDGFGDAATPPICPAPADSVPVGGDCDDGDREVNPGAVDLPDPAFADPNCDGVDGDRADLVFVDREADPAEADGSAEFPFADVSSALAFAAAEGRRGLALDADHFAGRVVLVDGVSLYGGYRAREGWARAADNNTLLRNAEPADGRLVAVQAADIEAPTALALLTIEAADHPGGSVYGLHATNADGLRLEQVQIRVGAAGGGAPGQGGDAGSDGGPGAGGGDCGGAIGAGGSSACGVDGFPGGRGGDRDQEGEAGQPAGCGGRGGDDGGAGRGGDGARGCDGAAGADGADGVAEAAPGPVDGWWFAGIAPSGTPGTPGVGGGGGGGGGGGAVIGGRAAAGGGGGAGGCGGRAGAGGGHGGGSFGVFAVDSPGLRLVGCDITSGAGGLGGAGGGGGPGGVGGSGGGGGEGARAFSCGGLAGPGDGGPGGRGGDGGRGGHGRGGDGGPSHPVVCVGAPIELVDSALTPGPGGGGGASPGQAGRPGAADPARGCE